MAKALGTELGVACAPALLPGLGFGAGLGAGLGFGAAVGLTVGLVAGPLLGTTVGLGLVVGAHQPPSWGVSEPLMPRGETSGRGLRGRLEGRLGANAGGSWPLEWGVGPEADLGRWPTGRVGEGTRRMLSVLDTRKYSPA